MKIKSKSFLLVLVSSIFSFQAQAVMIPGNQKIATASAVPAIPTAPAIPVIPTPPTFPPTPKQNVITPTSIPQSINTQIATNASTQPSIQTQNQPYIPMGLSNSEETLEEINPQEKTAKVEDEENIKTTKPFDTEKTKETFNVKDIYLNFENTELSNFVNYIAEQKQINLIPDKSLAGVKISLTIREPLSINGAWNIFLTILEMSGFTIVKVGDVHKVIPKANKLTEPLPSFINVPESTLPDSDQTIRYVKFLQNISVSEIQALLDGMLGTPHSIIIQPEINGMIITGKSLNIKSAMKVINELDQTGLQESVIVLKLKRINATDVKSLLDSLIQKGTTSPLARLLGKQAEQGVEYFSPTTRIIAEERTNSLILLGNKKSLEKIENFIVKHLDKELIGTESPLHIYELQHTDATQVRSILQEITAYPSSPAGQQAAKYGAVRGGVKYFRPMNFQVDQDGNRLIISSVDKQDWKMLKQTIKDIDKPQPQVAIESMFVTVDITSNKELGGGFRNKKTGQIGKGVDFQGVGFSGTIVDDAGTLLGNLIKGAARTTGATILSFGQKDKIWAFLESIKTEKNTSILTQPFITIANNTQASIEAGSTRRVVSEEGTLRSGYISLSASTKVSLKPQINLNGIIRFDIDISISDFLGATKGDKQTKNIKTNATVADGQVLVLGGFVKTKVIEQRQKTPILGSIPVLGWFFKYKKRSVTKTYTFIFIAPTIIKPRQSPGMELYTKMKLHSATRDIEESVQTKMVRDPIHNWFFNPDKENYSHKVTDFANARYQPTTVDIVNDPYYRSTTKIAEEFEEKKEDKKLDIEKREPKIILKKESEETFNVNDIDKDEYIKSRRQKLRQLLSTSKENSNLGENQAIINKKKLQNLLKVRGSNA